MTDEANELPPAESPKPMPLIEVRGEGYITRQNGEVVPFTLEGEVK